MIAKSHLLGLAALAASIVAVQATDIGNKPHPPLAGVELGERLTQSSARANVALARQAEPATADMDVLPARPERKVRVVYPLPR